MLDPGRGEVPVERVLQEEDEVLASGHDVEALERGVRLARVDGGQLADVRRAERACGRERVRVSEGGVDGLASTHG